MTRIAVLMRRILVKTSILALILVLGSGTYAFSSDSIESKVNQDIQVIRAALDLFRLDNGRYPTKDEGVQILVGRYIDRIPKDPWGFDYKYRPGGNNGDVEVRSQGQINERREEDARRQPLLKFIEESGVEKFVEAENLVTNPYVYENKVVIVKAVFSYMLGRNEGLFGGNYVFGSVNNAFVAINVPTTRFKEEKKLLLVGRVLGKKSYEMPSGNKVLTTQIKFIDAYEGKYKEEDYIWASELTRKKRKIFLAYQELVRCTKAQLAKRQASLVRGRTERSFSYEDCVNNKLKPMVTDKPAKNKILYIVKSKLFGREIVEITRPSIDGCPTDKVLISWDVI